MADTIFYEKNKKYNCRVHGIPYFRKTATIGGKRRSFYGDGEKDANKKIEEAKALAASGLNFDVRNAKFGEALHHWLYNVKRVDKRVKASTFSRYVNVYDVHIAPYPIASAILSGIDGLAMQAYLNDLNEKYGVNGPTIEQIAKILRMFFTWANDRGYTVKRPMKGITLPGKRVKGKQYRVETFTTEERAKILAYMRDSNYQYDTLITLAFATGMRQGELLALKWSDIEGDLIHIKRSTAMVNHVDKDGNASRYREVWDTKTENSVRDIPMLPATRKMLEEHRVRQLEYFLEKGIRSEYIFTTNEGELIDCSSLRKSYMRMLKRAGVPYRKFHAIRHTFATEAIRRGVPVKDLQMLLGHADITTTFIYVDPDENDKRNAITKMGAMM